MAQDERGRSHERVRTLADVVSVQIEDDRLDALATSLDAAMAMLADLDHLVTADELTVSEPYDAAWRNGGGQK